MWPRIAHFRNIVATAKKSIRLIFSSWVGLTVKERTAYFVWLNINFIFEKIDNN